MHDFCLKRCQHAGAWAQLVVSCMLFWLYRIRSNNLCLYQDEEYVIIIRNSIHTPKHSQEQCNENVNCKMATNRNGKTKMWNEIISCKLINWENTDIYIYRFWCFQFISLTIEGLSRKTLAWRQLFWSFYNKIFKYLNNKPLGNYQKGKWVKWALYSKQNYKSRIKICWYI